MKNIGDPYGSETGLIDKMIGSAYDHVKLVAQHLGLIRQVSHYLPKILDINGGLIPNSRAKLYQKKINSSVMEITTDIDISTIIDINLCIYHPDMVVTKLSSDIYSIKIIPNNILISFNSGANFILGGTAKVIVNYLEE